MTMDDVDDALDILDKAGIHYLIAIGLPSEKIVRTLWSDAESPNDLKNLSDAIRSSAQERGWPV